MYLPYLFTYFINFPTYFFTYPLIYLITEHTLLTYLLACLINLTLRACLLTYLLTQLTYFTYLLTCVLT